MLDVSSLSFLLLTKIYKLEVGVSKTEPKNQKAEKKPTKQKPNKNRRFGFHFSKN